MISIYYFNICHPINSKQKKRMFSFNLDDKQNFDLNIFYIHNTNVTIAQLVFINLLGKWKVIVVLELLNELDVLSFILRYVY